MVKSDNLAPQKARLNFHQGILNSMLFNLFRPMPSKLYEDGADVLPSTITVVYIWSS